tara:strand:+ start:198 stop:308 length:111 start_codon:yes stop_codon:yes gene_type:complete
VPENQGLAAKNELSSSLNQVKEKPGENIPPGSVIFF